MNGIRDSSGCRTSSGGDLTNVNDARDIRGRHRGTKGIGIGTERSSAAALATRDVRNGHGCE
jgi:hypothetical protein